MQTPLEGHLLTVRTQWPRNAEPCGTTRQGTFAISRRYREPTRRAETGARAYRTQQAPPSARSRGHPSAIPLAPSQTARRRRASQARHTHCTPGVVVGTVGEAERRPLAPPLPCSAFFPGFAAQTFPACISHFWPLLFQTGKFAPARHSLGIETQRNSHESQRCPACWERGAVRDGLSYGSGLGPPRRPAAPPPHPRARRCWEL